MKIPKSRYWSGLKSSINTRLNEKKRLENRELKQDPNKRSELRSKAQQKRDKKKLNNIELLSRTTYN